MKLLAFDIDNTLAEINRPILEKTVEKLRAFEENGLKIAFVSGKPAIYISGLVRQLGLREPIVIGENGLNIYYGCAVPPSTVIDADVDDKTKHILLEVKNAISSHFHDRVWFQPNSVSVTAFPKQKEDMPELRELINSLFKTNLATSSLVFYQHSDSIDIAPKQVNKGNAMQSLLEKEGWLKEEVIAIGDGENDIPMFKNAGFTIGVNFKSDHVVDINVSSIAEAIALIEERLG